MFRVREYAAVWPSSATPCAPAGTGDLSVTVCARCAHPTLDPTVTNLINLSKLLSRVINIWITETWLTVRSLWPQYSSLLMNSTYPLTPLPKSLGKDPLWQLWLVSNGELLSLISISSCRNFQFAVAMSLAHILTYAWCLQSLAESSLRCRSTEMRWMY